jgi:nitrogen regulatory protein P-II 1
MMLMELVITILKDYRLVEDLLLRFVDIDITGATVIEGQGMGQLLGDVPILAGLRGLFPGSGTNSFVILTAIKRERLEVCISAIEDVCGDMSVPGTGITFTLPIGTIRGLKESIH